jgi:hypothetical protein
MAFPMLPSDMEPDDLDIARLLEEGGRDLPEVIPPLAPWELLPELPEIPPLDIPEE